MRTKKFMPSVIVKPLKHKENNDLKITPPTFPKTTIHQPNPSQKPNSALNQNPRYQTNKPKNTLTATDLSIAGIVAISTVDWPEKLSCTLFLQGCPWKCVYCHNHEILDPKTPGKIPFKTVTSLLEKRKGLLDAVVFSGGEATRQEALIPAMKTVKEMGFKVGLHTAGAYPKKLSNLLEYVDWVGVDIKAMPEDYQEIVGRQNSGNKAYESLKIILESQVDYEVRLTVFPNSVTSNKATQIARKCYQMGVANFALQQARQTGAPENFVATANGWDQEFTEIANKIQEIGFNKCTIRTV